jgi:hypothetical protein
VALICHFGVTLFSAAFLDPPGDVRKVLCNAIFFSKSKTGPAAAEEKCSYELHAASRFLLVATDSELIL